MSFVLNNYQQISLFDSLGFLSERKQKILDKSWAKPFSDHIFSNIDEMLFAPLYSDKRNSRPNAPVNVIVGAQFELDESGHQISSCPAGNVPKSGSYIKQTDSIRVSFHKHQCEGCPYQSQCNPKIKERTASLLIPLKSRRRILESVAFMDEETRTLISRIRNGVETVPSILRNKYAADKMPVRGKLKTKQFFGFKVAALNFSKLMRFTQGKLKCRSFESA